jgi:hypothetical protein
VPGALGAASPRLLADGAALVGAGASARLLRLTERCCTLDLSFNGGADWTRSGMVVAPAVAPADAARAVGAAAAAGAADAPARGLTGGAAPALATTLGGAPITLAGEGLAPNATSALCVWDVVPEEAAAAAEAAARRVGSDEGVAAAAARRALAAAAALAPATSRATVLSASAAVCAVPGGGRLPAGPVRIRLRDGSFLAGAARITLLPPLLLGGVTPSAVTEGGGTALRLRVASGLPPLGGAEGALCRFALAEGNATTTVATTRATIQLDGESEGEGNSMTGVPRVLASGGGWALCASPPFPAPPSQGGAGGAPDARRSLLLDLALAGEGSREGAMNPLRLPIERTPILSGLRPAAGPVRGGTRVVLTGEGFPAAASASRGGAALCRFAFDGGATRDVPAEILSPNALACAAPPAAPLVEEEQRLLLSGPRIDHAAALLILSPSALAGAVPAHARLTFSLGAADAVSGGAG